MGDLGDSFRESREHQKRIKREREERAVRTLRRLASEDERLIVADLGNRWSVRYGRRSATYWPSTGTALLGATSKTFTATQLVDYLKRKTS